MCGIAGIFNFQNEVDSARVKKMTDTISYRGPDGEGNWLSPNKKLCLGHRRLSIIDLSERGAQPMHYMNRYTITFNGEIYNYIELRETLKNQGMIFHSDSDTEVILASYHLYKEKCLEKFDGMFAFAIWDNEEQKLFCARDRFGEKPFFFEYEKGNFFRFASEVKSLLTQSDRAQINRKMLFYYLAYNVTQNPFNLSETFFTNIHKLENAHYLIINRDGTLEKKCYWKIDMNKGLSISDNEAEEKFRELFFQSIKRRLRSDVPVGSSLSGGVDSTAVVCAINNLNKENPFPQNTFTARFYDPVFDEGKYIDEVASFIPIKREETWIDESAIPNELAKLIFHIEAPMSGSSPIAQWNVMKLAKEKNVTVLLDGQGADEVLAGYLHFFRPYFAELLLTDKKNYTEQLLRYKLLHKKDFDVSGNFETRVKYRNIISNLGRLKRKFVKPSHLNFIDNDFFNEFRYEAPPFVFFTSLNESLNFFSTEYGLEKLLTYADRNSMAFSREVRLPFLSHELVEFIFSLPTDFKIRNGWTKYILRKSMENNMPKDIAWRVDKLGYQPPIDTWLKHSDAQKMALDARHFLVDKKLIKKETVTSGREWTIMNAAIFMQTFDK